MGDEVAGRREREGKGQSIISTLSGQGFRMGTFAS